MIVSPLKAAIIKSGFRQKFVAEQAGLTENRLTCAVIGRLELTPDEKQKVAKALGKDLGELFPTEADENPSNIFVDVIGFGAGVFDRLKELGLATTGVNVAERPKDRELYGRVRGELWGAVRDSLKDGLSLLDDELCAQLSSPKYSFDSAGRIVIERKEDMKKRGVESPDRADALALTFYQGQTLLPEIVAIHEKCRECYGSSGEGKCPNENCPLYPFRLGPLRPHNQK